jgi:hypothetical protein
MGCLERIRELWIPSKREQVTCVSGTFLYGSSILGRSVAGICHVECVYGSRPSFILMCVSFHSHCKALAVWKFICGTYMCLVHGVVRHLCGSFW